MKYLTLILTTLLYINVFGQNDRLVFKTLWTEPNSKISVPLLVNIDTILTEIIQLTSEKIDVPTDIMASVRVDFDEDLVKSGIFHATNAELHNIIIKRENVIIDRFEKKTGLHLYLWNILNVQLVKWFYVQPYYKLSESWKNGLLEIPVKMFLIKIRLIPTF